MSIFPHTSKHNKPAWTHISQPTDEQLKALVEQYDLHSIIEEDLLSGVIQDKVDSYDDHLFVVMHFPKFDPIQDKYYTNPLFFIVVKDAIITLSRHPIRKLEQMHDEYQSTDGDQDHDLVRSPYYVMYKVIDAMYDKLLLSLAKFTKDIQILEQDLFSRKRLNSKILSTLFVKRRNIIFVNHTVWPQAEILSELHQAVVKILKEDGDVYFEDLQYKFDKIVHTMEAISENTHSLSTTYTALANIQTNSVISLLTIFTASIGILAMITWLYGMNVPLPGQNNPHMFVIIVWCMAIFFVWGLTLAKKNDWR